MQNDYRPRPWLYIGVLLVGSLFLLTYTAFGGEHPVAGVFCAACYVLGFVGFISDNIRLLRDSNAKSYRAVVDAGVTLKTMSAEDRKALANLVPELVLEYHDSHWVQKWVGIPMSDWLDFWSGCGIAEVRSQRSYPEGPKRDARNKIVAYLAARHLCTDKGVGNKSELWINGGYEYVKVRMDAYQFQFFPVRDLKDE